MKNPPDRITSAIGIGVIKYHWSLFNTRCVEFHVGDYVFVATVQMQAKWSCRAAIAGAAFFQAEALATTLFAA